MATCNSRNVLSSTRPPRLIWKMIIYCTINTALPQIELKGKKKKNGPMAGIELWQPVTPGTFIIQPDHRGCYRKLLFIVQQMRQVCSLRGKKEKALVGIELWQPVTPGTSTIQPDHRGCYKRSIFIVQQIHTAHAQI